MAQIQSAPMSEIEAPIAACELALASLVDLHWLRHEGHGPQAHNHQAPIVCGRAAIVECGRRQRRRSRAETTGIRFHLWPRRIQQHSGDRGAANPDGECEACEHDRPAITAGIGTDPSRQQQTNGRVELALWC